MAFLGQIQAYENIAITIGCIFCYEICSEKNFDFEWEQNLVGYVNNKYYSIDTEDFQWPRSAEETFI